MRDKQRINEDIKAHRVRLIDDKGEQVGIIDTRDALRRSREVGLDLVEVSSSGDVPVCRLMDYGKFRYQQSKKQHDAKRHQKTVQLKEIKMRPKIADHDFQFKLKNTIRFLNDGNKVKVSVEFRGREVTHRELGEVLLQKFQEQALEHGTVEQAIKNEARSVCMVLAPMKTK